MKKGIFVLGVLMFTLSLHAYAIGGTLQPKASLTFNQELNVTGKGHLLGVFNSGNLVATEVQVIIDGKTVFPPPVGGRWIPACGAIVGPWGIGSTFEAHSLNWEYATSLTVREGYEYPGGPIEVWYTKVQ
jgi:hypothetical protein